MGIARASAIRAERAVVRVANDRECTSLWDQITYWLLSSPAPPWQPLAEHELEPRVSIPDAGAAAAAGTSKRRRLKFIARLI